MSETLDALAKHFQLTEEERSALLPSGLQELFTNRVAWAKSHLKKAGILASPRRGVYQITPRGREVLAKAPTAINLRFLYQFPDGKSGDGGIDWIIKEDKLGLDAIYIQAKRWANTVGRPEIQKFVGALTGQRAKKGIFITTSDFTADAKTYALQIDTDYFTEE